MTPRNGRGGVHRTSSITLLIAALASCLTFSADLAADALKIVISGIKGEARRNLRAHLGEIEERSATQARRLERQLQRSVQAALQPFGYYEAGFELVLAEGELRIRVDPGPRVLYARPDIRLTGDATGIAELSGQFEAPPFREGEPLLHAAYDNFRDELLQRCRRLGLFDARYTRSELRVDRLRREATVVLHLDSGPRYRFGETRFDGTTIRPVLLRRLALFAEGDDFDNTAVVDFEQRLRDTGYFRSVAVQVEREAGARANVVVQATERRSSHYELGGGYSTDSRIHLRANRITPLMNDSGHSLRIESLLAEPTQSLSALYRMPHHHPLDDVLEITGGLKNERFEGTDSASGTLGVRHALKVFGDWSLNYGVNAEFEHYSVASDSDKSAGYLMPGISMAHTSLQGGMDPLEGHSYWSSFDFSHGTLGSSADFLRWRGAVKWLRGFADRNTTLLARLELGAIWTDSFEAIPASLRFYTGGDRSIRGYDFESLSPEDENGRLQGGRYLGVASVEVSRRIRPQLRIAAFVDGGSAFTHGSDDFHQSAGIGLRWISPIGQVRIDLAAPFADPGHSGLKLHISMGPPL